jgi:lipoprotein-anchoring transpeptidase ErfK/SrfK
MNKSAKRYRGLLWAGVIIGLALLPILVTACIFWSGISSDLVEPSPESNRPQAASTPTGIVTPALTRPRVATSTMAARQPSTNQASQTPTPVEIYIPVVEMDGSPLSFQTRLPLLIKSDHPPLASNTFEVPNKGKIILVDISDQHVYAYEKGELVFSFVASTGRNNLTRAGRYKILDKIPNAYSDPWGFWMPYWMGIYYVGYNLENGFHSLPVLSNGTKLWGSKIGSPVTYGCVVLLPGDMKKLFRWTSVGTTVVIVE